MGKQKLVIVKDKQVLTTSLVVAEELDRSHKGIMQLIREYQNDFNEFGTLACERRKSGGRPTELFYLNEGHLTFLIMMMRTKKTDNSKILEFKKKIAKEFMRMRETLSSLSKLKADEEYLKTRKKSKETRLKETDVIKKFIEYAKGQGSEKADRYYVTLTTMKNKSLFLIEQKFKNLREVLNIKQLDELKQADEIVLKALNDGMKDKMFYKDIYKLAKKRVEVFAELKGKSLVSYTEFKKLEE